MDEPSNFEFGGEKHNHRRIPYEGFELKTRGVLHSLTGIPLLSSREESHTFAAGLRPGLHASGEPQLREGSEARRITDAAARRRSQFCASQAAPPWRAGDDLPRMAAGVSEAIL